MERGSYRLREGRGVCLKERGVCFEEGRGVYREGGVYTQRNIFEILLNQPEIRLYLPFYD